MAKILVVDDDEFFAMALKGIIEEQKHEVVLAGNGKEACKILQEQSGFDCILSDMQMPQMGGVELAKWVKANKPIPFIIMTGFSPDINTQSAMEFGAANLLFKPFRSEEVRNALSYCLKLEKAPEIQSAFFRVPIHLVAGGALDINLYRRENDRVIKVLSRGELFERQRLDELVKTEGDGFYADRNNLTETLAVEMIFISGVLREASIARDKKFEFIKRTDELLRQKMVWDGVDTQTHAHCRLLISGLSDMRKQVEASVFYTVLSASKSLGWAALALEFGREAKWSANEALGFAVAAYCLDAQAKTGVNLSPQQGGAVLQQIKAFAESSSRDIEQFLVNSKKAA